MSHPILRSTNPLSDWSGQWGLCALRRGIQISMEAILACQPARSTEWLDCHPKSCELWRIRTGPIDVSGWCMIHTCYTQETSQTLLLGRCGCCMYGVGAASMAFAKHKLKNGSAENAKCCFASKEIWIAKKTSLQHHIIMENYHLNATIHLAPSLFSNPGEWLAEARSCSQPQLYLTR